LFDSAGNPQPITTKPSLGKVSGNKVIFIGTGKYLETADLTTTQQQTEYAIKDDNSNTTLVNPRTQGSMIRQTMTTNATNGTRTITSLPVNIVSGRGWYADYPESGERVNIDSQLVSGNLLVATIVPSNTACSPGGHSWFNVFNYRNGSAGSTGIVSTQYDDTIAGFFIQDTDGNINGDLVLGNGEVQPGPGIDNQAPGAFAGKHSLWRELVQ
jgi:type IV pilus assembly protein PilY1